SQETPEDWLITTISRVPLIQTYISTVKARNLLVWNKSISTNKDGIMRLVVETVNKRSVRESSRLSTVASSSACVVRSTRLADINRNVPCRFSIASSELRSSTTFRG
ncbi:unnamed protein product, partial [Sphacelaria rigidula]